MSKSKTVVKSSSGQNRLRPMPPSKVVLRHETLASELNWNVACIHAIIEESKGFSVLDRRLLQRTLGLMRDAACEAHRTYLYEGTEKPLWLQDHYGSSSDR